VISTPELATSRPHYAATQRHDGDNWTASKNSRWPRRAKDAELAELLIIYETDRLTRTRDTERQLGEVRERARFLQRALAMPGAVSKMLEEADAISAELDRLARQIHEEQARLSRADENFAALERNFLEALLATRVPGVAPGDKVVINRRTLIPEIWLGGDQRDSYSFYTAGSGGKKALLTIYFALALHRTAPIWGMPVPTLLIIDTPLKNIAPDMNPELVTAFYRYLYDIVTNESRDHQIVVIDQLLVEPPPRAVSSLRHAS
jgi:hypothetical protein